MSSWSHEGNERRRNDRSPDKLHGNGFGEYVAKDSEEREKRPAVTLRPNPACASRLDLRAGGRFAVAFSRDTTDWMTKGAAILKEEGFVVILGALEPPHVSEVLEQCQALEAEMLRYDPQRIGCRDPGRYSFGAASRSGHMLHHRAWARLLDCEASLKLLCEALGDFRFVGGGGDFVRGGTQNYQALHSDHGPNRVHQSQQKWWPPPKLCVNFTVQNIETEAFGPMRVIPQKKRLTSHNRQEQPPSFPDESEDHRMSKLWPLPAGAAIVRDLRVWHAGTPNTTETTRFLPNVELVSMEYARYIDEPHSFSNVSPCQICQAPKCALPAKERAKVLCPDIFKSLSEECQRHCATIKASSPGEIKGGIRPTFASLQQSWTKGGKGSGNKSSMSSKGAFDKGKGGRGGAGDNGKGKRSYPYGGY